MCKNVLGDKVDATVTTEHPNISLLKLLDLRNLADAADLFAQDFVWHFFNPKLPGVHGDYVGLEGLQTFFTKVGEVTGGTFKVEPLSAIAMGDELVVVHVREPMTVHGRPIEIDTVVVWRIVNGRFVEAWDIPSLHTMASPRGADDAAD